MPLYVVSFNYNTPLGSSVKDMCKHLDPPSLLVHIWPYPTLSPLEMSATEDGWLQDSCRVAAHTRIPINRLPFCSFCMRNLNPLFNVFTILFTIPRDTDEIVIELSATEHYYY